MSGAVPKSSLLSSQKDDYESNPILRKITAEINVELHKVAWFTFLA